MSPSSSTPVYLRAIPGGVRIQVHVQPNAAKNQIVGLHGEALKIKIKAPPEDGKANAELCAVLAKALGVAKSRVEVVAGFASRAKTVAVGDVSLVDVAAALGS